MNPVPSPILVVNPPLAHPAAPPAALGRALARAGADLYDANREYLRGLPGMERAWSLLRSPAFYQPQRCLKALLALERALETPPAPRDQERLWQEGLAPRLEGRRELVLAAGDARQRAAAQYLAGRARRRQSSLAVELAPGADQDQAQPPAAPLPGFQPAAPELVPPLPLLSLADQGIDPAKLADQGRRLVLWQAPEGLDSPGQAQARLRAAAKAGLWNHLLLPPEPHSPALAELARFAWDYPGRVHSWSWQDDPAWPRQDRRGPGRPWWSLLGHAAYLELYLRRHGRQALRRWRLSPEDGRLYTLGENIQYHFRKPSDIPPPLLEEIERLIVAGGKVKPDWVGHNLRRAHLIAYALEEGVLVGTETLKVPRPQYIEDVRKQTGLDLSGYLERGYISVLPHYRGLGVAQKLVSGLRERARDKKIFLAIPTENLAPQELTKRYHTRPVATYLSPRVGKEVSIWMPGEQEPDYA